MHRLLPKYGLLLVSMLVPVVISISMLSNAGQASMGFRILPLPRVQDLRWKPLVLRIDAQEHWYFDGKPVSENELGKVLRRAWTSRPVWIVYLDACRDLEVRVPIHAMDLMQGLGATVLMLPTRSHESRQGAF